MLVNKYFSKLKSVNFISIAVSSMFKVPEDGMLTPILDKDNSPVRVYYFGIQLSNPPPNAGSKFWSGSRVTALLLKNRPVSPFENSLNMCNSWQIPFCRKQHKCHSSMTSRFLTVLSSMRNHRHAVYPLDTY